MTIVYKLTTQNFKTRDGKYNETLWGENVEHTAPGGAMCTADVLHAYISPEVAVFLNPSHANLENPVLWECDGDVCVRDKGDLKIGCTRLKTLRQIELPKPTLRQTVIFAILCAQSVLATDQYPEWHAWAKTYLAGGKKVSALQAAIAATEGVYVPATNAPYAMYAAAKTCAVALAALAANASARGQASAGKASAQAAYAADAAALAANEMLVPFDLAEIARRAFTYA